MKNSEIISIVLRRVRNRIKLVDAGTGLIFLAAFVLLFLLVEVACDHLFALQKGTRLVFLTLLKISAMLIVCAGVFFPLLRRISDLYAAKLIEEAYPDFKNSLTSLLQVREAPETPPDALMALEHEAARRLLHTRPAAVVSTRRFTYAGYLLILAMVVSFSYSLLSSKSAPVSLRRALLPDRDIPPPTRTVIVSVVPGKNTPRVLENSSVEIIAKIAGRTPESVCVKWKEHNGERWSKSLEAGDRQRWRGRIENVGRGVEYFVAAGDTKSEVFHIKTVPPPIVQKVETEWQDKDRGPDSVRRSQGGDISVSKGTTVKVTAGTNNRLKSAALVTESGDRIPMAVSADGRAASCEISVERDDKYHIAVVDEYGHENENPPKYVISCRVRRHEEEKTAESPQVAKAAEESSSKPEAQQEASDKGASTSPEKSRKASAPEQGSVELAKATDARRQTLEEKIRQDQALLQKLSEAVKKREQEEAGREGAEEQRNGQRDAGAAGKDTGKEAGASSEKGQQSAATKTGEGKEGAEQGQKPGSEKEKARSGTQAAGASGKVGSKAGESAGKDGASDRAQAGDKGAGRKGTGSEQGKPGVKDGGSKQGASGQKQAGGKEAGQAESGGEGSGQNDKQSSQASSGGKEGEQGATGSEQRQSGGKGEGQKGNGASQAQSGAEGAGESPERSGEGGARGVGEGGVQRPGDATGQAAGPHGTGGGPGEGFYGQTEPGEDTRGQGKSVDDVITLVDNLTDMIEKGQADEQFLKEAGVSEEGLKRFVSDYREAIKPHRGRETEAGGGAVAVKRDTDAITFLQGEQSTVEISKDAKIGGGEQPDLMGPLFESKRSTISPEYRDMVDDYFLAISKKGSTASSSNSMKKD